MILGDTQVSNYSVLLPGKWGGGLGEGRPNRSF